MDVNDLLLQGLFSNPKYIDISCRYDHLGSLYDQECTDLEEFYHYRSEEAVIRSNIKDDQTVGDAVYGLIGEWNVVVDEISAKANESDAGTSTPPDTPVSVLRGFGTKFLTVTIRSKARVRTFIICRECGKRRVIYCAERLNHDQTREIEKVQDTLDYVCGSTLFPFGSQYFATVFVRESQECANPIETTYYSGVCAKFADICFFCGDLDVAGGEDPRIQSYTQKFSIVRPICFSCLEERPPADVVSHLDIHVPLKVFELGCGNTKKSQMLLNELLQYQTHLEYSPNDISKDFLAEVCKNLLKMYRDQLKIDPMPGDLIDVLPMIRNYSGRKLILWLSGLQCFTMDKQFEMLSSIALTLETNDACLITVDVTQKRELIEKAYLDFDYSKPNAKLYTNGVHVANRKLGGNIDLSHFKLEGRYVEDKDVAKASYNQVWLKSICNQSYHLENVGKTVTFEEGEKLLLYGGNGLSHKYTADQLDYLFARARLRIMKKWENGHCALLLCKRKT